MTTAEKTALTEARDALKAGLTVLHKTNISKKAIADQMRAAVVKAEEALA